MELDDLYREIIIDHARRPRNAASLEHVSDSMAHENPACGDSLKLEVTVGSNGVIDRVVFDGKGCAISTASVSIMTEQVRGKTVEVARTLAERFVHVLRGELPSETLDDLDELAAFKGVMKFPVRVKCATPAWHVLLMSLPKDNERPSVIPIPHAL